MVEELSHSRCPIKVRRDENDIQTDTAVMTFDSPKLPSRIRAGCLALDFRPYVPLPMRCYRCQRSSHGKDRCKKPAAVCVRCGKGGHVERDCSADLHCANCRGDHAANSKAPSAPPKGKKKPRRILRLSVLREQQKLRY
ncbi:nucleic-acid-binding protein from mobile element jockey [Plakobranchus ocellatus]|uniref:Nucleic-acid-binding protein from mobile element jockey n=1 Tax=Plakobranchus ocellatus TaxID=259542 RepID=A0AAV4C2J8_9GAST|nr:nucleic-acid-binding protein from mobile element jockey [Plakobranchus ocellatus]